MNWSLYTKAWVSHAICVEEEEEEAEEEGRRGKKERKSLDARASHKNKLKGKSGMIMGKTCVYEGMG